MTFFRYSLLTHDYPTYNEASSSPKTLAEYEWTLFEPMETLRGFVDIESGHSEQLQSRIYWKALLIELVIYMCYFWYLKVSKIMVNNTNLPKRGTTSDVGGMISASKRKNTVRDSNIEMDKLTCKFKLIKYSIYFINFLKVTFSPLSEGK